MGPIWDDVEQDKTAGIGSYLQALRYQMGLGKMAPGFLARAQRNALELNQAKLDIDKLTKSNNMFKLLTAGGIGAAVMALLNSKYKRESKEGGAPTIIRYGS